MSDSVISRIYKDSYNSTVKRQPNSKNGQSILIGIYPNKIYKKHMKRHSISLVIREMHIKITTSYCFTLGWLYNPIERQ